MEGKIVEKFCKIIDDQSTGIVDSYLFPVKKNE